MDMKEVLKKAKDLPSQAKEVGKEKVQEALDSSMAELQGLKPILSQCGFSLGDVTLSLTLPPNLTVSLKHDHEGATSLEELAANTELTNVQSLMVKALKNAYSFSSTFEKFGYAIDRLSLSVGLMPNVSIHLKSVGTKQ